MKPSFRHLCAGLVAGGAILLAASPASAGNVNWSVSVGVPAPVVYAAPAPVVYPAPVVAPVVYSAPTYVYPAAPAPVVYVSGGHRYYPHHPHHYHGRPVMHPRPYHY